MGKDRHEKLSVLPQLYSDLMARPLVPLTKGRLPVRDALYILYEHGQPILAGSPPNLDEVRILSPSFRAGFSLRISTSRYSSSSPIEPSKRPRLADQHPRPRPSSIEAKWLMVPDMTQRIALEALVLEKLKLTITDPRLRIAVGRHELNSAAF